MCSGGLHSDNAMEAPQAKNKNKNVEFCPCVPVGARASGDASELGGILGYTIHGKRASCRGQPPRRNIECWPLRLHLYLSPSPSDCRLNRCLFFSNTGLAVHKSRVSNALDLNQMDLFSASCRQMMMILIMMTVKLFLRTCPPPFSDRYTSCSAYVFSLNLWAQDEVAALSR